MLTKLKKNNQDNFMSFKIGISQVTVLNMKKSDHQNISAFVALASLLFLFLKFFSPDLEVLQNLSPNTRNNGRSDLNLLPQSGRVQNLGGSHSEIAALLWKRTCWKSSHSLTQFYLKAQLLLQKLTALTGKSSQTARISLMHLLISFKQNGLHL